MFDRLSAAFRGRRNRALAAGIARLAAARADRRLRIADIGGAPDFWRTLDLDVAADITLVNIAGAAEPPFDQGRMRFVPEIGDARDLARWPDRGFDLVVSNSVLEHVGSWRDIERAAGEMRRLADHGWVQTPAFGFPIEPHVGLPFFHWLPAPVRAALLPRLPHRGYEHLATGSVGDARRAVEEINLLTGREMRFLFPDATLRRERLAGLTKSFIAAWPPAWWA